MKLLRALGYVQLAPVVALFLVFWFLPCWAAGQLRPLRWKDGAWDWEVVTGSWLFDHYSRRGWAGTTLGFVIMYSPGWSCVVRTAAHERRHVAQQLVLGALFFPLYSLATAIYGYGNNPFEVDARKAELTA